MKKIIYLLGVIIFFLSCDKKEKNVIVDYTILSGVIKTNAKYISLSSLDNSYRDTIEINKGGDFLDTLNLNSGTYLLSVNKNTIKIYIESGGDLKLNADTNDFQETLSFSGSGSEINKYMIVKAKKEAELMGKGVTFYSLEEPIFKLTAKKIENTLKQLILNQDSIPNDFKNQEIKNLHFGYLLNLVIYSKNHSYLAKKPNYIPSESFLAELENLDYNNEFFYKNSENYRRLVALNVSKNIQKFIEIDSLDNDRASFKAAEEFKNEYIKNDILFNNAKMGITFTNDIDNYYNTYITASTNTQQKNTIKKMYEMMKTVAEGEQSPKFINYENYSGGTLSLDDLKGKYVYIDIWATWCGPCLKEIPSLKRLEKQFAEKNIKFVSISVDKNHDKWRNMVEDLNLGGIQLFSGEGFKSKFIKEYFVKGIPKFIFLDPEGKIITSSAPRPSQKEELANLFDGLNL